MEKNKGKSHWKVLDVSVCIAYGIVSYWLILTSDCGIYFILLSFCLLAFFWILGGHPYQTQLSKLKRRLYTVIRCILYSGALVSLLLPKTMRYNAPQYYPVQRTIMVSGYMGEYRKLLEHFMPHHIPSDAENYQRIYSPKALQSDSVFEISYFTNRETIAEYKKNAEEYGAKRLSLTLPEGMTQQNFDLDGDPSNLSYDENLIWIWRSYLYNGCGQNPDGMELYCFSDKSGNVHGIYVLSEETGYFLLCR